MKSSFERYEERSCQTKRTKRTPSGPPRRTGQENKKDDKYRTTEPRRLVVRGLMTARWAVGGSAKA
jgi:hypothetical protein